MQLDVAWNIKGQRLYKVKVNSTVPETVTESRIGYSLNRLTDTQTIKKTYTKFQ